MSISTPILVTGAAGYIGSHTTRLMKKMGYGPVGLDNLSTGFEESIFNDMPLIRADAGDRDAVKAALLKYGIKDVIHFAGSVINSESIENPVLYYDNNTVQTMHLAQVCAANGVERFLYSSSAGVYGCNDKAILDEETPHNPLTPYGASKSMSERIIADITATSDMKYIALRYFNVAGAAPEMGIGQRSQISTHILKIVCEALTGKRDKISIFGSDYPTPDGTCIRDYIHVLDLAEAHLAALEYLAKGGESGAMNCGYGHGYSVREVIDAALNATRQNIEVVEGARREGDPPSLVASNDRICSLTGWAPKRDNLEQIILSAYEWEKTI